MSNWQKDVKAFHTKFGLTVSDSPIELLKQRDISLRRKLIEEESAELLDALSVIENLLPSLDTLARLRLLAKVADGIADLVYVALGGAVSFGIDMEPIWQMVHEANMAKIGGSIREDGKILKPQNWIHPNVKEALINQMTPLERESIFGSSMKATPKAIREKTFRRVR